MKTETRKELKTNTLRATLERFWRGLWDGSTPTTTYFVIGGVALVALVVVSWVLLSNMSNDSRSKQWLSILNAGSLENFPADEAKTPQNEIKFVAGNLEKIAIDNPGSPAARVARFQEARLMFTNGMDRLGKADSDAIANVEKAGDLYEKLASESADAPLLQQEALLGAAKAREALGSFDKAKVLYEKLANAKPETPLTQVGKTTVERYNNPEARKQMEDFYRPLLERINAVKTTTIGEK